MDAEVAAKVAELTASLKKAPGGRARAKIKAQIAALEAGEPVEVAVKAKGAPKAEPQSGEPITIVEREEGEVHQCFAERANNMKWVVNCETCDYHEVVTRGRQGLNLEHTAQALAAAHKGRGYVVPGSNPPVTADELEKGDLFLVQNPYTPSDAVMRFVGLGEDRGGVYVQCWEVEKHKGSLVGRISRSFKPEEVVARAEGV